MDANTLTLVTWWHILISLVENTIRQAYWASFTLSTGEPLFAEHPDFFFLVSSQSGDLVLINSCSSLFYFPGLEHTVGLPQDKFSFRKGSGGVVRETAGGPSFYLYLGICCICTLGICCNQYICIWSTPKFIIQVKCMTNIISLLWGYNSLICQQEIPDF